VTELAAAAWAFVPLAPAGRLAEAGFRPPPDLPARLRLFLDCYGLADRRAILPALRRCVLASAARAGQAAVDAAAAAAALEFQAAELRWLHGVLPGLAQAL
jgi:hypothetical protein